MKLTSKTISIALLSILTSITAINSSVRAELIENQPGKTPQQTNIEIKPGKIPMLTKLECNTRPSGEFSRIPFIKNTTRQTLPAGKVIHWQAYLDGKLVSNNTTTLTQPLDPGQIHDTKIILLEASMHNCRAHYW